VATFFLPAAGRLLARVTGNQPHENNWLEVKSGAAE
jgi:hypothetical protein